MNDENQISEVTRRAIVDWLLIEEIHWAGRLRQTEFLSRLYDLTALPSGDARFNDAAGDIRQHCDNWDDWEPDWVFFDSRFNVLHAEDRAFLSFLCETVHPVVRPDSDEAKRIVDAYNDNLRADGWELFVKRMSSGRPIFAAREVQVRAEIFTEPTGWNKVDRQVEEVRLRLETAKNEEQFQAVGLLCREVLISVCEAAYDPDRHRTPDEVVEISQTDAKRMLECILTVELGGGGKEEARAHAKATMRLALALQHKRTANFQMAALCAEATISAVNIVAVVSGRRNSGRDFV